MFIDTKILKRLMKEAFKTGLSIGKQEETIYIGGRYWDMEIYEEFLPKEVLATIVELTGQMPVEGECFVANKDSHQMVVMPDEFICTDAFDRALTITDIVIVNEGKYKRVLLENVTKKAYLVNETFINMISNKDIDKEKREEPVSLYPTLSKETDGIVWENNVCKFRAYLHAVDKYSSLPTIWKTWN